MVTTFFSFTFQQPQSAIIQQLFPPLLLFLPSSLHSISQLLLSIYNCKVFCCSPFLSLSLSRFLLGAKCTRRRMCQSVCKALQCQSSCSPLALSLSLLFFSAIDFVHRITLQQLLGAAAAVICKHSLAMRCSAVLLPSTTF